MSGPDVTSKNAEPHCRTFLVEDAPADKDAFSAEGELGPHERVAKAIAELVESNEPGGKMIGLEGIWGSGKSTVVNFLKRRFENPKNLSVIFFDAWAHEGDPLRRTFLESVVSQLQEVKWLDNDSWNRELDSLANRRKVLRSKSIPQPTVLGTLFALAALTIPLGMTLLKAGLDNGLAFDISLPPNWLFICGLGLTLSPFLVLLGNWFCVLVGLGFSPDDTTTSKWAFLSSHTIIENRTETLETPNPTSIEFEGVFARAMSEALGKNESCRLLLVLDNLDRVDPANALEIWSTLQTFLQDRRYQKRPWFPRLWILVPYDPTGLRKLWDGSISESLPSPSKNASAPSPDSKLISAVSSSFIDKSFQLRFYVPPPILSDWKGFLLSLLRIALPDHDSNDFQVVFQVYERYGRGIGQSPTPRELKVFVNQIGAIHRQWLHQFPISHVAYFVLSLRAGVSLTQKLLATDYPDTSAQGLLGEGLRASLAGLAFNVQSDRGMELLLSEPIRQALIQADVQEIKNLAARYKFDFWAVLEQVATAKLSDIDAPTVAKVASTLHAANLWEASSPPERRFIIGAVQKAAKRHESFVPLDGIVFGGISALIGLVEDRSWTGEVLRILATSLNKVSSDSKQVTLQPAELVKRVLDVLTQVCNLGHEDQVPKPLTMPFNATEWHSLCPAVSKGPAIAQVRFIRPKCEMPEVSALLQEAVIGGSFNDHFRQTLLVTNRCVNAKNWNEFVSSIRQRLDAGTNIASAEVVVLLTVLLELCDLGRAEAVAVLKELGDNGHLLHYLHKADSENHNECVAVCSLGFLKVRPKAEKPAAVGNSEAGFKLLTKKVLPSTDQSYSADFLRFVSKYGSNAWLIQLIEERKVIDPLIASCLKQVVDASVSQCAITSESFMARWVSYRDAINDEHKKRFAQLVGWLVTTSDLTERLMAETFATDKAELYLAILQTCDSKSHFCGWCMTGTEALSTQHWLEDFKAKYAVSQLALVLENKGLTVRLGTSFADAVASVSRDIGQGRHFPPENIRDSWRELLDSISEASTRRVLADKIVDTAVGLDGKIKHEFFDLFHNDMANPEALRSNGKVVSHLFSPLVRDRHTTGLKWLQDFLSEHPGFFDGIRADYTIQDLETRLKEAINNPKGDEAEGLLLSIAEHLGITPDSLQNGEAASDSSEGDRKEPSSP